MITFFETLGLWWSIFYICAIVIVIGNISFIRKDKKNISIWIKLVVFSLVVITFTVITITRMNN